MTEIHDPKPGTLTAMLNGCTCSSSENMYGLGINGDGEKFGWAVKKDCPLHGTWAAQEAQKRGEEAL